MKLYRTPSSAARRRHSQGCVATVGAYDGLHLGHQAIIKELNATAKRLGLPSLVLSFEPIPKEYFAADDPPARLMRFYEKFRMLDAMAIDEFCCTRFGETIRTLSSQQFIDHVLVDGLDVKHLVVGDDFRFAVNRSGTIADLRAAGEHYGFGITQVPAVFHQGERITSTTVRQALKVGELDKARLMLGRDYQMSGRIVEGQKLGRKLGFPTANIPVKRRRSSVNWRWAPILVLSCIHRLRWARPVVWRRAGLMPTAQLPSGAARPLAWAR